MAQLRRGRFAVPVGATQGGGDLMPFQWPWRSEKRSASYADAVTSILVDRATGTAAADASATAALEMASGLWGRAMMAAVVSPATARTAAITPAVLQLAGRQAIRDGGAMFLIDVTEDGRVRLLPAWSWDTHGGADPDSWLYRVTLAGPSSTVTRTVPAEGVVWLPFSVVPDRPWIGRGPLDSASSTSALAGNLELRLSQEAGSAVGSLIPIPTDGGDGTDNDPLQGLKEDINASRGGVSLVETTSAGWGEGRAAAPQRDWRQARYGADPPETLRGLRSDSFDAVCMAAGLPPGLSAKSDGTLMRESWREFIMGAVEPVAKSWGVELAAKLGEPGLTFSFSDLWAHDLIGRSQALKRMVESGMTLESRCIRIGHPDDGGYAMSGESSLRGQPRARPWAEDELGRLSAILDRNSNGRARLRDLVDVSIATGRTVEAASTMLSKLRTARGDR